MVFIRSDVHGGTAHASDFDDAQGQNQVAGLDSPHHCRSPRGDRLVRFLAGQGRRQPWRGQWTWAAQRPAADEKHCPGKRTAGRSFKGDRSPALVQGDGQRPHGLVHPDRGVGRFDVTPPTNTADRPLAIHIGPSPPPPGQFLDSWVDLLLVKGFDAGQPILYLSTETGDPLAAVLERSVYVPALANAPYNGGDDFLGSARERLFGFFHGQTRADNNHPPGFPPPLPSLHPP